MVVRRIDVAEHWNLSVAEVKCERTTFMKGAACWRAKRARQFPGNGLEFCFAAIRLEARDTVE
jgi:hypothetical protein